MKCLNTYKRAHDGGVWSLMYDRPTGTKLISASPDSHAKIWDVKSGKAVLTFSGHTHYCYKAVFDNDAEHIATVGADKTMNYWDIRSNKAPIFKMEDSPSCLMGVDFMPNDQQIITTSMDGEISIYSVKRQERVFFHETLQEKIENLVQAKKFGSAADEFTEKDERILRAETKNIMYNVHTYKEVDKNRDEEGVFMIGMLDGEVNKIKADFDKIQIVDQFHGHSDGVRAMEVNKTGDKLISCCADHSLRIWDYQTCKANLLLAGHTDVVVSILFFHILTFFYCRPVALSSTKELLSAHPGI